MTLPNFLIVGTMKSGTTVLYEFVLAHEDAAASTQKEIHYFSLNYFKGQDWYLSHFPSRGDKLTGEASPTYFDICNTLAIPRLIKKDLPDAKLILIVRDPIERAISHFQHLCKIQKIDTLIAQDINDFFAIPFESTIRATSSNEYYANQILSFSCYHRKFLFYSQVFERDVILILTSAELRDCPQLTMKKVFEFLSLTPFESAQFEAFKYSTGSKIELLSNANYERLANLLYPDYEAFCRNTGIEFNTEKMIRSVR